MFATCKHLIIFIYLFIGKVLRKLYKFVFVYKDSQMMYIENRINWNFGY